MIKINEDFEFERADQCWELHHWKDGTNPKTKEPVRTKTTTYHATVSQVCKAVIDRDSGSADSLKSFQDIIERSTDKVCSALLRMQIQ